MSDEQLLGYLFDALDADESDLIEQELERNPLLRARLEELRRLAKVLSEDDSIEPPLGLAARALSAVQTEEQTAIRQEWSTPVTRMRAVDCAVVACLLSVAAVIVLPAIATLRGDQARLICADRMRQVGVALGAYAHDERGQLPFVAARGLMNNAGSFAVALREKNLLPLDGFAILVCPASNNSVVFVPNLSDIIANSTADADRVHIWRRHMGGSFGYLLGFEQFGTYRGRTASSSDQPVLADRPPRADELLGSPNSPNHAFHGQNVLFGDGAVRWLSTTVWANESYFLNSAGIIGAGLSPNDVVIGVSEATPYPVQRP